jgi:large subunit ribosomal protein L16
MMNFRPKETKYRKAFKGRIKGVAKRGYTLAFGDYGLKAVQPNRIKENQIESARKAINNFLKRSGELWIRIFPNIPVTKKPLEVRMGKGKGPVEYYISRVKPGMILFELSSVSEENARLAFRLASDKLPVKTKFTKLVNF